MVPTVADDMIFNDELRGHCGAGTQREGRGSIQFLIRDGLLNSNRFSQDF